LGDYFLWEDFWKLQKQRKLSGYFFQETSYVLILTKRVLGCTLGDFFTNPSGHTLRERPPV
jgi:hypothetical protein